MLLSLSIDVASVRALLYSKLLTRHVPAPVFSSTGLRFGRTLLLVSVPMLWAYSVMGAEHFISGLWRYRGKSGGDQSYVVCMRGASGVYPLALWRYVCVSVSGVYPLALWRYGYIGESYAVVSWVYGVLAVSLSYTSGGDSDVPFGVEEYDFEEHHAVEVAEEEEDDSETYHIDEEEEEAEAEEDDSETYYIDEEEEEAEAEEDNFDVLHSSFGEGGKVEENSVVVLSLGMLARARGKVDLGWYTYMKWGFAQCSRGVGIVSLVAGSDAGVESSNTSSVVTAVEKAVAKPVSNSERLSIVAYIKSKGYTCTIAELQTLYSMAEIKKAIVKYGLLRDKDSLVL